MTTNSSDSDRSRRSCCHSSQPAAEATVQGSELPELFRQFRHRIDRVRSADAEETIPPSGPADLALTVVAEALAIGEAMSRIRVDATDDGLGTGQSPAIYAEIDSRFVEHRTRALRSALHGVDDYVWWGGLIAAPG